MAKKGKEIYLIAVGELDEDELDYLLAHGWRTFVDDTGRLGPKGIEYIVDDNKFPAPLGTISFDRDSRGEKREIPVLSLPLDSYTVTDIDQKKRPTLPPRTIGVVKTDRGWQVVQKGKRDELSRKQDPDYLRMSRERGHWNQRTFNREGTDPRTLFIRRADLKDTATRDMAQAWIDAGGKVRAVTGPWSAWDLRSKGKEWKG